MFRRFMLCRSIRHFRPVVVALLAGSAFAAHAADIAILSAGAVRPALGEAMANFERSSGHHPSASYMPVGTLLRRLADGAAPDLIVLTEETMAEAQGKGWVAPGSAIALGKVGVGVAVNEHAPSPDVSTPEALRRTLLAAKSITYIDPSKGTSGKHFAQVLERLGIADAVRAKTTLGDAGYVVEPVARGEIELGIQQVTEILSVKGVKLAGMLPDALQKITVYAAAPARTARDPAAVQAFLAYLRTPEVRALFVSKGFAAPE